MSKTISDSIAKLGVSEGAAALSAAQDLFLHGKALADSATRRWLADPELANLLVREAGELHITVGIAVHPNTFERIRKASHSPRLAEVPSDQDAEEFELSFPGPVRLDILTTKAPDGGGAIARFLKKFGEGIQQVEFAVTDVHRATHLLQTRFDHAPIYPQTRPGADGTRVNFFLVSCGDERKVLVELVENPRV